MLFQDLGLLILLVRRVLAEVPDPEKDLVEIGRAQSEYFLFLLAEVWLS